MVDDTKSSCFLFEVFFFFKTLLGEFKKNFSYYMSITLVVVALEFLLRELLSLTDVFRAQADYIHELSEVVVVY